MRLIYYLSIFFAPFFFFSRTCLGSYQHPQPLVPTTTHQSTDFSKNRLSKLARVWVETIDKALSDRRQSAPLDTDFLQYIVRYFYKQLEAFLDPVHIGNKEKKLFLFNTAQELNTHIFPKLFQKKIEKASIISQAVVIYLQKKKKNVAPNKEAPPEQQIAYYLDLFDQNANKVLRALVLTNRSNLLPIFFKKYKERIDINYVEDDHNTLLHIASYMQYKPIVHFCLANRIDPRLKNNYGETSLHVVCRLENTDLIKIHLKDPFIARYCINYKNKRKETVLHLACKQGCADLLQLLLSCEAICLNHQNIEGNTPLHLLCLYHPFLAHILLNCDQVNPTYFNKFGETVLHITARLGHVKLIKMLLNEYLITYMIDHKNHKKETPLGVAARRGHTQVVALLLKHKAATYLKNGEGLIPFDQALKAGHIEICKLLLKHCNPSLDLGGLLISKKQHISLVNHFVGHIKKWPEKDLSPWIVKFCGEMFNLERLNKLRARFLINF